LGNAGERRMVGLVARMVEAGAAVEENDGWNFAHVGTVGAKLGALDIEKEPGIADFEAHDGRLYVRAVVSN